MRCIQKLITQFIVIAVLTLSASAFAGFNWGDACAPGSGNFQQDIQKNAKVEVGIIPAGKANLYVKLTSPVDVDIQLEDVETGTQIVNWQGGLLSGTGQGCANYEGLEYCYSGYGGDGTGAGHEYIKIKGTTNRPVKMFAFGYAAGAATVDYSWDAPTDCVDAGSGSFDQVMAKNDLAEVGTIPAGKENVEVKLEAAADLDIEIYHGDKVIVAWNCKNKTPHFDNCLNSASEASVVYEGMTITYSGYGGVDGQPGNEFIKIDGKLTQPLTVKAFAFAAGTAKVTYKWGPKAPVSGTPVAAAPASGSVASSASCACIEKTCTPSKGDNAGVLTTYPADGSLVAAGHNWCFVEASCGTTNVGNGHSCEGAKFAFTDGWVPDWSNDVTAYTAVPAAPCPATTPSSTPDPASYCGPSNVAWDSGINMCVVAPQFSAAKVQCASDLSAANSAKATCDSAKASCETAKQTLISDLSNEIQLYLACNKDKGDCGDAKATCETDLSATNTAKTAAESSLATCQSDLKTAQATSSASGIDNQCVALAAPSHGTTVFTDSGLNSTQSFACDMGYQTVGSTAIGCGQKSHDDSSVVFGWNGVAPSCIQICSEPELLVNGTLGKSNGNFEGSVVSFSCLPGTILKGNASRTCQNGAWNGQQPTCQVDVDWSDVTIWTYVETGTQLLGKYYDKLVNSEGVEIAVQRLMNHNKGGWTLNMGIGLSGLKGGLYGRIALRNLPGNTVQINLQGTDYIKPNNITQIVEITGKPFPVGMGDNWYKNNSPTVHLGGGSPSNANDGKGNFINYWPNQDYVHSCPVDTVSTNSGQYFKIETKGTFHKCTVPLK